MTILFKSRELYWLLIILRTTTNFNTFNSYMLISYERSYIIIVFITSRFKYIKYTYDVTIVLLLKQWFWKKIKFLYHSRWLYLKYIIMKKSLLMQEFIYYFLPCKIESLQRIDIIYYRSCSANQNYRNCVIYNRNGGGSEKRRRKREPLL